MSKSNEQDIRYGCRTDLGQVREQNEDSLLAESPLFVVADGMGGHAAGEVASEIAIESMRQNAPRHADCEALAKAIETANHEVIKGAMEGKGREGMGTTMTAAVIDGNRLCIAQVGDSRAYLLHNGKIQQITRDHSLMADLIESGQITPAEARVHPNRSLITRALGNDPNMYADQYEIDIDEGDRLLLCSDGLSGMLTDDIIEGWLNKVEDPQECANKLIEQANAYGGLDNITVIVADVLGSVKKKRKKMRKAKRNAIIVISILLVIIAASIAFGAFVVNNSAYLCEEEGFVSVYKGIPGNFLGLELSNKEYGSDVYVKDLRESTQEHFKEGIIKVDNLDAAERVLENYRQEAQELKDSKAKSTNNNTNKDNKEQKKS